MEHPLISNIDDLSDDDLLARINDLTNKLSIVQRSGNGHLANQLRMAIETFQTKYRSRLQAQYNKSRGGDFEDKIKIQ